MACYGSSVERLSRRSEIGLQDGEGREYGLASLARAKLPVDPGGICQVSNETPDPGKTNIQCPNSSGPGIRASKQSGHSDGSDAVATNRRPLAPQEGETERDVRLLQHHSA